MLVRKIWPLHLNLVPETVNVIYYDPATDPYTTLEAGMRNYRLHSIQHSRVRNTHQC